MLDQQYSGTSLSGLSKIWSLTTSLKWANMKAPIDSLRELSVPLKADTLNSEEWTKARAASNKSIENESLMNLVMKICASLFVKLNKQKSRIKMHMLNETK